jgi:hypothetical protein
MKRFIILVIITIALQYSIFSSPTDTIKNELYGWNLTNCYLIEPISFDTIINDFQILNQNEKVSISNSFLGKIGSPWKSNLFHYQIKVPQSDFYYDQNYDQNLLTPTNQVFYHSKLPYFDIDWTTAQKKRKEDQLNVLYTQNINKKLNVGMRYRLIASGGEFPRAISSQHSFNLFTSYLGEKYSIHAAFFRNKISANENGGIDDSIADPQFAPPLLKKAESVYFKRSIYISQQYKFGITKKIVIDDTTTITNFREAGRLNHIIRYDDNYRAYHDKSPNEDFYQKNYIDTTLTKDSVYLSKLENTLYWSFKEISKENFKGRLTLGATYDIIKFSSIEEPDTLRNSFKLPGVNEEITWSRLEETKYRNEYFHTLKLYANLSAKTKNFVFDVNGSYYIKGDNGYKNEDKELNLIISKSINIFKARTSFYGKYGFRQESPNLLFRNYISNNFKWQNSFKDIFISNLSFGIDIPKIRLNAEVLMGTVQNHVYFDSLAMPNQLGDLLNVVSVSVNKNFKLWIFGSRNRIVYQIPNRNEALHLPAWAAYHSLYIEKFFEKNKDGDKIDIHFQLGYDLNYSSQYQALGYMPATGTFFLSNSTKTGDYSIINVFLNLRIKSVLLFFKMEHLNNQFRVNKYYFVSNNYPAGTAMFKFGVSWRFMN